MAEKLVIDAAEMVDYLVGSPLATRMADRLGDCEIFVPAPSTPKCFLPSTASSAVVSSVKPKS